MELPRGSLSHCALELQLTCTRKKTNIDCLSLDASLSSIPYHLLLAEVTKRQDDNARPQCGSGKKGAYDTPLHVFALILILALSTVGAIFPSPCCTASNMSRVLTDNLVSLYSLRIPTDLEPIT